MPVRPLAMWSAGAQAEVSGFCWLEPSRERGKPSRQQIYTARLCRHIRDGELPAGATAVVPPWWKQGDAVVAIDAAAAAAIERDVVVCIGAFFGWWVAGCFFG
eukprot:5992910-Amphidinium_carterae.2